MEQKLSLSELEEAVRVQTKRKKIETAILGTVSCVGFLSAALVAPNAVKVLQKAVPDLRPLNQKQSIKRAIGRMIQRGYLQKTKGKYHITDKGKQHLLHLTVRARITSRKKKWDGKWRVVIFDIPEKYRNKRTLLRRNLMQTGFVKIQNSVWVYPFKCDEIVALLKFEIKLGRSTIYMIVDAIEDDEWLKKHFNLE